MRKKFLEKKFSSRRTLGRN